jgi:hypothetical protein
MINIETLRKYYSNDMILISEHAAERFRQRNIKSRDVRFAVFNGEIIEHKRKSTLNSSNNVKKFSTYNKTIEFNEPISYTDYDQCGLSYKKYIIKAKYTETKRIRKLVKFYHNSYSQDEIINMTFNDGYEAPITINIDDDFKLPTSSQLDYAKDLGIPINSKLCKYDISCLIDRTLEHSGKPNSGLIEFADEEKLFFSYCIGKKQLYDVVFDQLDDRKTVAFFIFSIYRFLYNDREANLNKSLYRNRFFAFADNYVNNEKFMKSMYNNYSGRDLRYFGTVHITNKSGQIVIEGGSNRTYCYQKAKKFLVEQFGTP